MRGNPGRRRSLRPVTHRTAPALAGGTRRAALADAATPRVARSVAVCLFAVPAMLLAHLVTARTVPTPGVALLVTATVFAVTAAAPVGSRWRLALVVGLAQAAGHGLLAVTHPVDPTGSPGGCLPMVGRGAELGVRLALFRQDASCPQGEVVVGPTVTVAVAALLTAVLILAAHTAVAVLAAALVRAAELAVDALRSCARLVRPRPTRLPVTVPVPAPRRMSPVDTAERPARPQWNPRPALLRGPPAVATA